VKSWSNASKNFDEGEEASSECPNCPSKRNQKDGIRETKKASVQRFLCRDCGYRFSGSSILSTDLNNNVGQQVCAILTKVKTLAAVYPILMIFETNEYIVKRPTTAKEEDELIIVGFEYVRFDDKEQVPIYRKRK